jgi:hypothetical protein
LVILLVTGVSAAAAATWLVNSTTGNNANDCMSGATASDDPGSDQQTVEWRPIIVAAGTYLEPAPGPLMVSKTLTLLGAQAGVDARNQSNGRRMR